MKSVRVQIQSKKIFRDERESDPKRIQKKKRTEPHENHTSTEVVPTSGAHDLLDSTLREGQLGWCSSGLGQTVDGRQQCRARPNTRYTRQRMGRLTDTKVRGFMVIETNNEACAQLQLALHTRWSLAPTLELQLPAPIG